MTAASASPAEALRDHIARLIADDYLNQALFLADQQLSDPEKETTRQRVLSAYHARPRFHMIVRGDSMALPRPYRYDQFHFLERPQHATRYHEVFDAVAADRLSQSLGRRVLLSNQSTRGMTLETFAAGLGRGLDDVFFTQEPDLFVMAFGYSEAWTTHKKRHAGKIAPDDVSRRLGLFKQAMDKLAYFAGYMPLTLSLVLPLPYVGRELEARFPGINRLIDDYNAVMRGYEQDNMRCLAPFPDAPTPDVFEAKYLHRDGQHYTPEANARIADAIVEAAVGWLPSAA